jgi:hypothetical protein
VWLRSGGRGLGGIIASACCAFLIVFQLRLANSIAHAKSRGLSMVQLPSLDLFNGAFWNKLRHTICPVTAQGPEFYFNGSQE